MRQLQRVAAQQRQPASEPLREGATPKPGASHAGQALLQLQRTRGNRYVQGVVNAAREVNRPAPAPIIQTKLVLGAPDDKYEREADHVAQQVAGQQDIEGDVQVPTIQRLSAVPGNADSGASAVDTGMQQTIQSARGSGQPLPETVRGSMEQALGADFGGVRLHTDERSNTLSQSLQAHAFTTGHDIFFRRGSYDPKTQWGQKLLAHELAHVVQQDRHPKMQSDKATDKSIAGSHSRIQRYLFGGIGSSYQSVNDFKTRSKGFATKGKLSPVVQALVQYQANHPMQNNQPKQIHVMSLAELQTTRQQLEAVLTAIDQVLITGPDMGDRKVRTTEPLRVDVQNELMKVVKKQGVEGAFGQPVPFAGNIAKAAVKNTRTSFIAWLKTDPVYLKWAGQGAGACADAAREIEQHLKVDLFSNEQDKVMVRGILAFPPFPIDRHANHVVAVAKINNTNIIIDPTMGQFLGGEPGVFREREWKLRMRKSRVAFGNGRYGTASKVIWKDCDTANAAVAFAPGKGMVTLVDRANEQYQELG